MEFKRIMSKSLGVEDWVEVGGKIRFDGKVCKVTKIEGADGVYTVYAVDCDLTTYDALNLERPIFAVNAIAAKGEAHTITVTDVTAAEAK